MGDSSVEQSTTSPEIGRPIDVTPNQDGGVLKEVKHEGVGSDMPGTGDKVSVHYVGTLADGTPFDSSRDRGQQFQFELGTGNVIRGWDLGVATMRKGELAVLTCRAEYAYGAGGSPPKIPPNATLVFEVELFSWKSGEDLSPASDESIVRHLLTGGEGYKTPNDGASVKVHLIGRCGDRTFEDRELEFNIGEGCNKGVVEGVELALKKFKKGERSKLDLEAKYAFGPEGNTDFNIPPKQQVQYEVTLIDFEKAKESWEMDTDEKLEQSEIVKTKGTNFFKAGNLKSAIAQYSKIVDYLKEESGLTDEQEQKRKPLLLAAHLNIALCNLKIGNQFEAIKSCDEALKLDENSEKGLFRRGQAYLECNEYENAVSDLKRVLDIEPNNKTAKNKLAIAQQKIKQQREKEKKTYAGMFTKFAELDAKKMTKGKVESGLEPGEIGEWTNDMAQGMIPLSEEVEAFGEQMPDKAAVKNNKMDD